MSKSIVTRALDGRAGTVIQRLWDSCEDQLPTSVQWLMGQMVDRVRARGRAWVQLDALQVYLEHMTDEFAAQNYFPGIPYHGRLSQLEDLARRLSMDPEDLYEELCLAGDAVAHARDRLSRFAKKRYEKGGAQPKLSMCFVCWRSGRAYPRGKHFCSAHAPMPENEQYKAALKLRKWRARFDTEQAKRVVFDFNLHKIKAELSSGLSPVGPEMTLLERVCRGDNIDVEATPSSKVELAYVFEKTPAVREFLVLKGADLRRIKDCLRMLDPIEQSLPDVHHELHSYICHDARHFIGIVRVAEAWLGTALLKFRSRGRGRAGSMSDIMEQYQL